LRFLISPNQSGKVPVSFTKTQNVARSHYMIEMSPLEPYEKKEQSEVES